MNSLNGGYAMIKYNSTQEELQIAYRSKKPVLCYDENRRAHWAVIEETATESVDDETQEPITIYEYSYRLIDEASGRATLDDIVDSKGNKRFVEGTGTTSGEIASTYCKWSLSGTHIMFVCAGSKNSGPISSGLVFATFTVPDWILNKIVPTWVKIIETKSINFIDKTDATLTPGIFNLRKNNNVIDIQLNEAVTLTKENNFRIQFDLLIDAS